MMQITSAPRRQSSACELPGQEMPIISLWAQRMLIVLASPTLVVVMAVVALLVLISSPGPVLLRRTVQDARGQSFTEYRFRSVYLDASSRAFKAGQMGQKDGRDPRLTAVGDLLIRSGLNRLPNVINVWRGNIALMPDA